MNMNFVIRKSFVVALFSTLFLILILNTNSSYAATQFFVDSAYDRLHRSSVGASQLYSGNKVEFYIEDSYLSTLGGFSRDRLDEDIEALSDTFDNQIYNTLTRIFGLEWTPGIDNNPKLTVLLVQMKEGIGGFFRTEDELAPRNAPTSNEREMVYLNIDYIKERQRVASFLAHEFQHVINYNQKNRLKRVSDEVWFNEMLSEVAPTMVGLDVQYKSSNLETRVSQFLEEPGDPLLLWQGKTSDYGVVSILGQYLYDNYGSQFFTILGQTPKTGMEAINEALLNLGKKEKFSDVFKNWAITVLLNNCLVIPEDVYCYKNPNLSTDNLKLGFNRISDSGDEISNTDSIYPWQGQWFKYERGLEEVRPDDHVFVLEFSALEKVEFTLPYVVFPKTGTPQVFTASLKNNTTKIYVEDFGFKVSEIVIIPLNVSSELNNPRVFTTHAYLSKTIPQDAVNSNPDDTPQESVPTMTVLNTDIKEGALIRAQGDTRVYITKGSYKRWIQSVEIMNMYGHLRWEDIIEVSQDTLNKYVNSNVVRFANDPSVYSVTSNNTKQWIKTEQEFTALGYSFGMVYEINEREFNFYK